MSRMTETEGIKVTRHFQGHTEDQLVIEQVGNTGYIVRDIGGQVGEITYRMVDVQTWVLEHVYLEEKYRGGTLARRLLDLVVNDAREEGVKIIPSCSYALAQFQRHEEYADVWKQEGMSSI